MRVGKSETILCDQCGHPIEGCKYYALVTEKGAAESHYHADVCMAEYLLDEHVQADLDRRVREEFNWDESEKKLLGLYEGIISHD